MRLDQIRQDILHTKRVIKHNKRVFECRENDLKIRSDFQNNPRNEIQKLFANVENIPCPIEVEDLNTFWSQESKSCGKIDASFFPDLYSEISMDSDDLSNAAKNLTIGELQQHLKHLKSKKATGPDRIPNEFWKLNNSHIQSWLLVVYKKCMNFGDIPKAWKFGTTTLLYKGGISSENRNWRPITLLSTIYKLFASIIASRLSIFTKHLSKHQKGFQKINGCQENLMTILRTIEELVLKKEACQFPTSDLYLFFIDFRNAFGSIEHDLIFWVLNKIGIPDNHILIKLIKNMYTDSSFSIATKKGKTRPIKRERGVFQGCPLSPILFLFAIDPILRWLNQEKNEYKFLETLSRVRVKFTTSCLGYADDLLFLRRSLGSIKRMCQKLLIIQNKLFITVNPKKSAVMASFFYPHEYNQQKIAIGDYSMESNRIPLVREYIYLGLLLQQDIFNNNSRSRYFESLECRELTFMQKRIDIIHKSKLAVSQKLRLLKWILYGRIKYLCPSVQFSSQFLDNCDKLARNAVRTIFKLSPGTITNIFHVEVQDGGFGLPILSKTIALQRLKFWSSILSRDGEVKDLMINSIIAEAYYSNLLCKGMKKSIFNMFSIQTNINIPSQSNFLIFKSRLINNILQFCKLGTPDSRALNVSYWLLNMRMFYDLNMSVSLNVVSNLLDVESIKDSINTGLKFNHPGTDLGLTMFSTSKSKIQLQFLESKLNKIKRYFKDQSYSELLSKGFQAKLYQNLSSSKRMRRFQLYPVANLIRNYNKFHGDKFIQFILRARLNQVGNAVKKYIYKMDVSSKCPRIGCNEDEWTSHITSGCRMALHLYTIRHNTILYKIEEKIQDLCSELIIDKATLRGNRSRPDISLARFKNDNSIQIGEVTVVFDQNIQEKREFKINKYVSWLQQFKTLHPTTNSTLAVFCFGVLGTLDEEIINNLKLLQLSKDKSTKFAYYLANYAMYKTYSVWVSRCKANFNS